MKGRNPWLDRGVFHWAHQGGAREGPSNTLYAMTRALEAGAHGIELDVHRSNDNHLVLIHDATLERTTDGTGRVADHDLVRLQALDPAFWWVPGEVDDHGKHTPPESYVLRGRAPSDPNLRIPTLEEVLERFPSAPLTIEVKDKSAASLLIRLLRERGRRDDVIVTSFKDSIVRRLRRLDRDLPLAPGRIWNVWFLVRVRLRCPPRRSRYVAVQLPPRYRRFPLDVINPRLVAAAHEAGMAVHAWTIDDESEMRRLIELGVDGIMTDRPSVLASVLGAGSQAGSVRHVPPS